MNVLYRYITPFRYLPYWAVLQLNEYFLYLYSIKTSCMNRMVNKIRPWQWLSTRYHLADMNICMIPLVTGCSSFWLLPALRVFGLLYLLLVDNSVEQGILGKVLYREQIIFGFTKIEIRKTKKMSMWRIIFQKKYIHNNCY